MLTLHTGSNNPYVKYSYSTVVMQKALQGRNIGCRSTCTLFPCKKAYLYTHIHTCIYTYTYIHVYIYIDIDIDIYDIQTYVYAGPIFVHTQAEPGCYAKCAVHCQRGGHDEGLHAEPAAVAGCYHTIHYRHHDFC